MSATTILARTLPPSSIRPTVSSSIPFRLAEMTTVHPAVLSAIAAERPMPDEAPVTSAMRDLTGIGMVSEWGIKQTPVTA